MSVEVGEVESVTLKVALLCRDYKSMGVKPRKGEIKNNSTASILTRKNKGSSGLWQIFDVDILVSTVGRVRVVRGY
jgi:hypothetical protein